MKEQIQDLIAHSRVEEALQLLVQSNSDAVLLQARYNNGKKQYNMGLIDFSEWQRIQNQVNFAILEMAASASPKPGAAGSSAAAAPASQPVAPQVFISYNHNDSMSMQAIRGYLEKNDIKVVVDIADMAAGEDIQSFIDKAFKENHFVLSIISENSLLSGWVNKEMSASLLLNRLSATKWIPVSLDRSCFDPDFYSKAMDQIDAKIAENKERIKKALEADRDIRQYNDEMSRLRDLSANLGTTLESLKRVLVTDITGAMFESGMQRVLNTIRNSA